MIFDASRLALPARLRADLCVVGSGAGGATVAAIAAEAGMSVVVLEAGEFLTPADMTQREEAMLPRLYWESGGRTTADRGIAVHQGRGVGGSTLHNLNLCKRIPASIRARWHAERHLERLAPAAWDALYDEVERLLAVSVISNELHNRQNLLLERGCSALGWRGGPLTHNRSGCIGSGFCEIGCAYDAKNNAAKVFIPRAVHAGARVLTRCQATRIRTSGTLARGVDAVALDARTREPLGPVTVDAARVCVSGSATSTAALLLRSNIGDPAAETGMRLHLHPGVVAAGEFAEPVRAWDGIPQTYECTEHLDFEREDGRRAWIVPAFAHPVGAAVLLPGHGALHRDLMQRYAHLAAFSAMVHDRTCGRVTPSGELGLTISYRPDGDDWRELLHGLSACARLLFAAGARRVIVPAAAPLVLDRVEAIDAIASIDTRPGALGLTAVHPMGSVPMGDDPKGAAVGSDGKHHHVGGLWVADGSLFPSSIGVPPQLSIYALGLHVGRAIALDAR